MTCIAALVRGSKMWMGWDSAGSNNNLLDLYGEGTKKAFAGKIGEEVCLIGGAGSKRYIELLEHSFEFPALPDSTTPGAMMRWLIVDVIKGIRSILKEGGIMTTKDGVESPPGNLLVGVRGRLYEIEADLGVRCLLDHFGAIGSGAAEARGVFFGFEKLRIECEPETAILTAREAAERWTPGVRGPFQIINSS